MPIVDCDSLPEILMRAGVSGRWLSGSEHGAQSVSVLRNWVEPGVTIPRHLHDQEEIVLVEQGEIWVEIDGHRQQAGSGQTVIIPPRATAVAKETATSQRDQHIAMIAQHGRIGWQRRSGYTPLTR